MADDSVPDDTEVAAPRPGGLGDLRRRGIYLLPNLFTTGVLFCGFFAVVQAMNGLFETACVAVYVAAVLDGMDGRVARWTNTQSEFGAQYDSIADMVAFGAAPALVAYTWVLKDLGTAGWIGAFIYCAAAGIRLARFNTNIGVVDKRYFQGLPSPSGAALLMGLRIIDVSDNTYTIELTGDGAKLDAFIKSLDQSAIIETVRTGASGIGRGNRILRA